MDPDGRTTATQEFNFPVNARAVRYCTGLLTEETNEF